MRTPHILMFNGASGSGKTTIAKPLSEKLSAEWIHPDGLWDPTDDQRTATFRAVEMACQLRDSGLVIIDKQFRHEFMLDAFEKHEVVNGNQILIHCSDEERTKRLLQRDNWHEGMLGSMLGWSQFLLDQAIANGVDIVDTTNTDPATTMSEILSILEKWGWVATR